MFMNAGGIGTKAQGPGEDITAAVTSGLRLPAERLRLGVQVK